MKIAEYPSVMIRFFKKGTGNKSPGLPFEVFFFSSQRKKTYTRKVKLQMSVNLDKNLITLIDLASLITVDKIILIC